MRDDLALIEQAAREVGVLARRLKAEGLKVWSKDGGSPVTNADIAVDTLLRERLGAARFDGGHFPQAIALFDAMIAAPELPTFLTLAAYEHVTTFAS